MSATATETHVLTKEDVSYLRRADDLYARHDGDGEAYGSDGGNVIGAVKRAPWGDRFAQDVTVLIPVNGNGRQGNFTSLHSGESVIRSLRAGDAVSFYWYPDAGTNENARDAGLHVDYLYLDVTRGKRQSRYLVAVSVCPDNSVRMCK